MRRALTLLLFIALACVLFAPHARAESGDSVDVKANADAPPPQAEETVADDESIPAEKLVEPLPESKPMPKKWVTPQIKFKFKEFYQPLPTAEEWEAVMRAILGGTPAPKEAKLAPATGNPEAKPPVKKPQAKPEEKKPAAEEPYTPLTTQEAVTLAMEVKASDLTNDFARVVISSGRVSGNTSKKEYDIVGDMTLYYRDIAASSKAGHIYQETETVTLTDTVEVTDPNYSLTAEELNIRFKDKTFDAKTFVRFKKGKEGNEPTGTDIPKRQRVINIFKNEPTELYANALTYNWDTEQMDAQGEVKVVQKDFTATMDSLNYSPQRKTYLMQGNVFITLLDTAWLFEKQIVEKRDEDLAHALMEKETTIEAATLETGEDSDVMTLKGSADKQATISQEDKELKADEIVFDDKAKLMTATGNASFYQENADWMRKGKLIEGSPDKEAQKFLDNKLTSVSPQLTFNYDKRILHQWGGVSLESGDEKLIADELDYNEKEKILTLTGNVGYFRGPDEYLIADKVIIDLGKNIYKFSGIIESYMFTTDESRKTAHPPQAPAEGDGTAGTGGETAPPAEGGASTPPGEATPPPPPPPPPTGGLTVG
jgi:lipopolysaccharide assembly outer membrane protein LptD (OstA)